MTPSTTTSAPLPISPSDPAQAGLRRCVLGPRPGLRLDRHKERAIADYTEADPARAARAARLYRPRANATSPRATTTAPSPTSTNSCGSTRRLRRLRAARQFVPRQGRPRSRHRRLQRRRSSSTRDYSFAYHERGIAYRMKGDREHAIADFRQADPRLQPGASPAPSRAALERRCGAKTEANRQRRARRSAGVLDLLK